MTDQALAIDSLRRCALFAHVDDDGLTALAELTRRRRFRRNEVIFHQDDVGDSLHIVAEGAVKIVLPSQEGEEAIIASLKPGDFFGELALLDGSPRSTTATALEPTETLALPRDQFQRLLAEDPRLVTALLQALAGELRRLTGPRRGAPLPRSGRAPVDAARAPGARQRRDRPGPGRAELAVHTVGPGRP